jgi:hypothetical protein
MSLGHAVQRMIATSIGATQWPSKSAEFAEQAMLRANAFDSPSLRLAKCCAQGIIDSFGVAHAQAAIGHVRNLAARR